jgi:hypothetical protein
MLCPRSGIPGLRVSFRCTVIPSRVLTGPGHRDFSFGQQTLLLKGTSKNFDSMIKLENGAP